MDNVENKKVQCIIRLDKDDYEKIKVRLLSEGISFQKVVEILLLAYVRNNKEVERLVKKFVEDKKIKRKKNSLNQLEMEELLRKIETEYSPLRHLEKAVNELEEEEENEDEDIYP